MGDQAGTTILDLFDRPIDRHIEEVIKVDQTNVAVVREEIEEYIPTESIRKHYRNILERFREQPNKPNEGIGIWISGFFGAGKSSFAKILGYALENRDLGGSSAAQLFSTQTNDPEIQALLGAINQQIPTKAVIFDVSTDQTVTDAGEKLTDIVYRVLLRELGYAPDREIAELEIELEDQEHLAEFVEAFSRTFPKQEWDAVKQLAATARNRASRVLHELDPQTYPNADTWAKTPKKVAVSANFVAERAWKLMQRRGAKRALVFVIDEVGQYVARSTEKMLDLQGLVQALGREGKNRAAQWKGQVWIVATSQERLSEVVDNLDGKQVELARLRDRFAVEVDLAPSDIREVTSQRVLKKRPGAKQRLQKLYEEHKGRIAEATRVTGKLQVPLLSAESFAELYPFLPYQIDLVIDVVSGLRTQAGASRHVGGANRTIIKLAQQVLINEKTLLGQAQVGRLVTLDALYDLLEGLVSTERRRDVEEIEANYLHDGIQTRVAKALALLQWVPSVARTPENLAAVLHPSVDAQPQREQVVAALTELEKVSKARQTEQGWELLSHVGKSWEEERRGIEVFPRDRALLLQQGAEQLFGDVSGYRHRNLRTFNVGPVVNDQRIGRAADVDLRVRFVTDPGALGSTRDRVRQESSTETGLNAIHWVVPIGDELLRTLDDLHRSQAMIARHERDQAPEEARLLGDERNRQAALRNRALGFLRRVFKDGESFFRGVQTQISDYGAELDEAARGALRDIVPRLYAKFDLAAVQVKGAGDAAKILESEGLAGLPSVYYDGTDGLGLIRRDGGEYRLDAKRPALEAVSEFIKGKKDYGEKASGKALETEFTGYGYGWELEVLMLLAATLLRAGEIEVYSGKRFTSYADAAVRDVFKKPQAFRAATFAPRTGALSFAHRSVVAKEIEELYGTQVSIEEGAIATALRKRMPYEAGRAYKILSVLQANDLPGQEEIQDLEQVLRGIADEESVEDAILAFHNQREVIRGGLTRLKKLEAALSEANLDALRSARDAARRLWPQLEAVGSPGQLAIEVVSLTETIGTPDFFDHLKMIAHRTGLVRSAYTHVRGVLSQQIEKEVSQLVDDLRNREIWEAVPEASREILLRPFHQSLAKLQRPEASLSELQSNLQSLESLHADAVSELIKLYEAASQESTSGEVAPVRPVHRIRASRFASTGLRTEPQVNDAIDALRDACLESVARGETVVLE